MLNLVTTYIAQFSGGGFNIFQGFSAPKVSGNHVSDQISDVPRLARHNFQHFSPKRKLGSTSYPLNR